MPTTETFVVPGLATIVIESHYYGEPLVTVTLDPDYNGDLRPIEKHNTLPGGVYLRVHPAGAHNNAALAKLMEALHQWDHDHDGRYDGDQAADAIEHALWQTDDAPKAFVRPARGLYTRLLMRLMPRQPERHVVFNYGDLKPRFRWYHYAAAVPLMGVFILLFNIQIEVAPWTVYSVVTGFMAVGDALGINTVLTLAIFVLGFFLLGRWRTGAGRADAPHTYGLLNKAAVFEEQAFREGTEDWSTFGRVRSCLVFGAIHMVNLIYPIATILPIAVMGGVYMWVYLRTYRRTQVRRAAVLEAALWHRVYNRLVLIFLAVWLVAFLGLVAYGVFAAAATVTFFAKVSVTRKRRQQMAQIAIR